MFIMCLNVFDIIFSQGGTVVHALGGWSTSTDLIDLVKYARYRFKYPRNLFLHMWFGKD